MQIVKFMVLGIIGAVGSFFSLPYVAQFAPRLGLNIEQPENETPFTLLGIVGGLFGLLLFLSRSFLRKFLSGRARVVAWVAFAGGLVYGFVSGDSEVIGAALLFTPTVAQGPNTVRTYSFTVPFCPAIILFANKTDLRRPTEITLIALRVEVAGRGTILNLTDEYPTYVGNFDKISGDGVGDYNVPTFQLADGTLKQFATTITYTVDTAILAEDITPACYGHGTKDASVLISTQPVTVLPNNGITFKDFYRLMVSDVEASSTLDSDIIQVSYRNGFTQQWTVRELLAAMDYLNFGSPFAFIDNSAAEIREVYFSPSVQYRVIEQKFIPV